MPFGIKKLLIELEVVLPQDNSCAVLVFAFGCAIMGGIAVLLDLAFYTLRGQSLLKLQHGKNSILFFLAWVGGSFGFGYIGQIANLFQVSLSASVLVGFTWPVLLTNLLSKLREKEIETEMEPEQLIAEEA